MVCQLIQDHPRRCGENKEAQAIKVLCTGSPPQVRGKPDSDHRPRQGTGITPAGAGKTGDPIRLSPSAWDHPRRCGENCTTGGLHQMPLGITPAGAGKTLLLWAYSPRLRDHPRRCGENAFLIGRMMPSIGSPPQVRGKLSAIIYIVLSVGITPAGAGKTVFRRRRQAAHKDHPRRCGENACAGVILSAYMGSPPQVRGKPESTPIESRCT